MPGILPHYRLPSLLTNEVREAVREDAFRWLTNTVASGARECVLDGSRAEAVDAGGIGLLLLREKRVREAGASFTLSELSPVLRSVLANAGLDRAFRYRAPD